MYIYISHYPIVYNNNYALPFCGLHIYIYAALSFSAEACMQTQPRPVRPDLTKVLYARRLTKRMCLDLDIRESTKALATWVISFRARFLGWMKKNAHTHSTAQPHTAGR